MPDGLGGFLTAFQAARDAGKGGQKQKGASPAESEPHAFDGQGGLFERGTCAQCGGEESDPIHGGDESGQEQQQPQQGGWGRGRGFGR